MKISVVLTSFLLCITALSPALYGQKSEPSNQRGSSSYYPEPTEAEMLAAVKNRLTMMNKNIENAARVRPDKNNPMQALVALSGQLMKGTRYSVVSFKKLGAVKAEGRPGYMCDYLLEVSINGGLAGAATQGVLSQFGPSMNTARFIKVDGKWVWLLPKES